MDIKFCIQKKTYDILRRGSVVGLGISFIYYGFLVDQYPKMSTTVDFIGIICFVILIVCLLLKIFNRIR